ncbi:MAG TPA: malectin domain-containing carbohydrate-binding protein, partial [Tepidisphaeraceae bacterium]|nr:malectin domain-containing carbohydrate-binding protein [Tepidisphaeraceae bacterium]
MFKKLTSGVRLRRAVNSVVERLEDRRLLAGNPSAIQSLPFLLDFDQDGGGMLDKDGQGTGFTHVQVMNGSPDAEYVPSLIDLDTTAGVLTVTAQGTGSTGTNYNDDSTLRNALETKFDATGAAGFTVSVRLVGPLSNYTANNNQAGLMFGPNQDNYVKLVAVNVGGTPMLQFIDETLVGTSYTHSLATPTSYTDIGGFNGISTLDLFMSGNATTGKVLAYYRINGGAVVKLGGELTLSGTKKNEFFNTASTTGILAAKKSSGTPDFTATFDRFEILPGAPLNSRPSITATRPGNGASDVVPTSFVAADLMLPTSGAGVDSATLTSAAVRLVRTSDGALVNAVLNTDAAGGAIVLQPSSQLDPNTSYTFQVTDELKDTSGASFLPYSATFTTGNAVVQPDSVIAFEKIALPTATGQKFTGVSIGPDGRLYAPTDAGDIYRYPINANGTLGVAQVISTVKNNNGGNRLISGVTFDPASTASNLILWVAHSDYKQVGAANHSGKISRLTGSSLSTYRDFVVDLPRSYRDHTTNQPVFGPDGKLYFQQGSMSAMGGQDFAWNQRTESQLTAAVLQVDVAAIAADFNNTGPINVRTSDVGGSYNPFASNAPVKLYATGVRNGYDLLWHSNGHLYAPTNGSAANGTLPATPTTSQITNVKQTQDDWLYDVKANGYYGHPNPSRNEFYAHGGNPTSGVDVNEQWSYPVGTQPAANYSGPAYVFGQNYSPNGVIEYKSNTFGGALKGKMLVARYSGGDDILILDVGDDGSIGAATSGLAGMTHFVDPLDITENTLNGYLYVAEYGGNQLTLMRPIAPGANVSVEKEAYHFNDVRVSSGTNVPGPAQAIKITNNGTQPLAFPSDGLTIGGANANQFVFVGKPELPQSIQPGQSLVVNVAMNATSLGLKTATLTIKSNDPDQPNTVIALRGLGTSGIGGNNEPSLAAIFNLYQIPTNVGDTNPGSTALYSSTEPLGANEEVSGMERLLRADSSQPVTITPLAVMGLASNPALTLGYYTPGSTGAKTPLFTVPTADAQTVAPTVNGTTLFDPGNKSFGLYTTWPGFKDADNVNFRDAFSEDALNTWAAQNKHKFRFYPMKTPDGTVVPNTYVVGVEEFDGSYDGNDIVFIISNVRAAAAGPEVGVKSLDNVGLDERMAFHRIGKLNETTPDVVHDTGTLRIRNTGNQPLTVSNVTVPTGWVVLNAPSGPIAPGTFYDMQVKFVLDGGTTTLVRSGTLTFNTNDSDEPTVSVALGGRYQVQSEHNKEPDLQGVFNLFGFKTLAVTPGVDIQKSGGKSAPISVDEVMSAYWQQADSQKPIQVRQLAAFHTQGKNATIRRFPKGSPNSLTSIVTHDDHMAQSILPARSGTNRTQDAFASFNATGVFGFNLAGELSDDTLNPQGPEGSGHGHHVRFYVAKDANGNVIPDTYLVGMDYLRINFDYQDNIYLITNIKPEGPAAPTGLTATASTSSIALNWNDNAPNNFAGYDVYRSTSANGTYTKLNGALLTQSQYTDTTATPGVAMYYRVIASNTFNSQSAPASITATRTVDTSAPATPRNLVASGGDQGVSLTWTANTESDLAGYDVYRSDSSNGTFTKLNGSRVVSTTFVDVNAPAGVVSYYRVRAVDTSGLESGNATANATRQLDGTTPSVPMGLMATGSASGVTLDWADNGEQDLAGYNVYFSTSSNTGFTKLNDGLLTSSFFAHAGAPAGVVSYYRVTAVDHDNNESPFAAANGVAMDGVPPAIPANLSATASTTGISLDWNNNSDTDLAGYNVFRASSPSGPYAKVNGSLLSASSYFDGQAPAGAPSYYYVVAVDLSGNSSTESGTASATRPTVGNGTTVRVNAGGGTYTDSNGLTWSANTAFTGGTSSNYAAQVGGTNDDPLYYARRYGADFAFNTAVANGNYTLRLHFAEPVMGSSNQRRFGVTAEDQQILTNFDIFAEAGGKLNALVKTFNVTVTDGSLDLRFLATRDNAIVSAIEVISAGPVTPTAPLAPSGLSATATSSSQVGLTWTDNAGDEAGYTVERSSDGGTTFTSVATLAANATSYTDGGLVADTTYHYRVTATGAAGAPNSVASNVASATTQSTPVSGGTTVRVNAGGGAYTDALGQVWAASNVAGAGGFVGGINSNYSAAVGGTDEDPLYFARR